MRDVRRRRCASQVLVIAHRGACGYVPEHTLAAYELAARMGADYLEPDLVVTRDGVLVCRHEPQIGGTTDVAQRREFADREVTKTFDGQSMKGWWVEDFTLDELKTLRAIERLPGLRPQSARFDGRFAVPTFAEMLRLRRRLSRELDREIGVYPEAKHPTHFQQAGLPLEPRLLDALRSAGLNRPGAPVFVQSFETTSLRQLRRLGLRTNVIQLLSDDGAPYDLVVAGDHRAYADLATPHGLREMATYAHGIGPDKGQVIPTTIDGCLGSPTHLVRDAHAAGLLVHPYTFRTESASLPQMHSRGHSEPGGSRLLHELTAFIRAGIDGFFIDQPDVGVAAREEPAGVPGAA